MAKRKSITKSTRFKIFSRDNFTCQYCGKAAPTIILEIDHVVPVSKGGDNENLNLITSCFDCNRGKSAKNLDDKSILAKQKEELQKLFEQQEQMEFLIKQRKNLIKLSDKEIDEINKIISEEMDCHLNSAGKKHMTSYLKKYGFKEVIEVLDISINQYYKISDQDNTRELVFTKLPMILACRVKTKDNPYLKDLYYINGIIRNRMGTDYQVMDLLEEAHHSGISNDELKEIAKTEKYLRGWKETMRGAIANA